MKTNPFTNTLQIAGRALSLDQDIDIVYVNLPPGAGAQYIFADPPNIPRPIIELPKMDMDNLNSEQKSKLSALLGHEMLHHIRSSKKICQNEGLLGSLCNCLEDARIEIDPEEKFISIGSGQDILKYRKTYLKTLKQEEHKAELNPWGWLSQALKYYLPGYGEIYIPEQYKKHFKNALDILNKNQRFKKATHEGETGSLKILDLAKEIINKWQEEDTETEEDKTEDSSNEQGKDSTEKSNSSNNNNTNGKENLSTDQNETNEPNTNEDKNENINVSIEQQYQNSQDNPDSHIDNDILGKEIVEIANSQVKKGNPYIPYSKFDREIIPEKRPYEYRKIYEEISLKSKYIRTELTRSLVTRTQTIIDRGQKRGILDFHSYHKILKGSKKIYSKKQEGISLDSAVSILIDMSGSMLGERADLAVKVGASIGEALSPIRNIPFEILAYNSSNLDSFEEKKAKYQGYTRKEIINYWIIKSFNEPWNTSKTRLGACCLRLDFYDVKNSKGICGECNVDHENLLHAAARVFARPEKKKTIIVICDGMPSGHNGTYNGLLEEKLFETVQRIKKAGIKLFCYGIQSENVGKFYNPDFELINTLDDLDQRVLRRMGKYLLGI